MDRSATFKVRLMEAEDFDAVLKIDEKVLGTQRRDYYEMKFDKLFASQEFLPTSLVAETEEGALVGFVMGQLYIGEFGIFREEASLDTIGVDPEAQHRGVGERLIDEFMEHLVELGVTKVHTLVDKSDEALLRFFSANKFAESNTVNLERKL